MNERKGLYVGFRFLSKEGQMVAWENSYGPVRTTFLLTAYFIGGSILIEAGAKGLVKGAKYVRAKIQEHKIKKEIESK